MTPAPAIAILALPHDTGSETHATAARAWTARAYPERG